MAGFLLLRYPWIGTLFFLAWSALPIMIGADAAQDYRALSRPPLTLDALGLPDEVPLGQRVEISNAEWECDDEVIPRNDRYGETITPATAADGSRLFALRPLIPVVSCRYLHEAPVVGLVRTLPPNARQNLEAAGVQAHSETGRAFALDTTTTTANTLSTLKIVSAITLGMWLLAALFLWLALTKRNVMLRVWGLDYV